MADIRLRISKSELLPSGVPSGIPADTNSGVFGGRLSWYPTPYWTLIASVDESVGRVDIPNLGHSGGDPQPRDHWLSYRRRMDSRGCGRSAPEPATRDPTTLGSTGWIMAGSRVRHSIMKYGEIWR